MSRRRLPGMSGFNGWVRGDLGLGFEFELLDSCGFAALETAAFAHHADGSEDTDLQCASHRADSLQPWAQASPVRGQYVNYMHGREGPGVRLRHACGTAKSVRNLTRRQSYYCRPVDIDAQKRIRCGIQEIRRYDTGPIWAKKKAAYTFPDANFETDYKAGDLERVSETPRG